jgi:small subunit ribosomal protein S20
MPIIKSAKKRVKVAQKAAVRNHKTKRTLKTAIKTFQKSLASGSKVSESHSKAQSAIAKASKKHVIHKNKAARQQKQLAARAKAAASAKKAAPKKVTAKKPPTKKTTSSKKS